MVFLDETGLLLGLMRPKARSEKGSRVYDLQQFVNKPATRRAI